MSAKMILDPNPANGCFGCGGANESGMRLTFALDTEERRASGKFVLGKRYAGGAGFAHGGVIAILLDEAMGAFGATSGAVYFGAADPTNVWRFCTSPNNCRAQFNVNDRLP
jgi:hypothetical protein